MPVFKDGGGLIPGFLDILFRGEGYMNDTSIRAMFEGAGDLETRHLRCGSVTLNAYYIDGLTSGGDIADYVFRPLSRMDAEDMKSAYEEALQGGICMATVRICGGLQDVAQMLVNGFCVVLFPGVGALAFEAKTGVVRGPAPPDVENTVKGPKEAFVETVRINTSLVRRHLRTPDLGIYETTVGRRSLTNVAVVWVKGITNPDLVEQMKQRLDTIDIDGLISPSAVEEYVTGSRLTPFPLLQYTERADRFSQALLDGRIGLLVDGLPLGYLAPVNVGYLMESMEDRSRDAISASCIRVLRYGALALSLLLPAIYIAMIMWHSHWLPMDLLDVLWNTDQPRPFTTTWEIIGMLIAFELLQESGIHLPQAIGQSVSTIGGIVVGSAAVEAGLIAPVVLIVVSAAGICGFVLPNRDLAQAVRVCRFALCLLAAWMGLPGIGIGLALLIWHLFGLKSMGTPYLKLVPTGKGLLRARLVKRKHRDAALNPKDKRNQK